MCSETICPDHGFVYLKVYSIKYKNSGKSCSLPDPASCICCAIADVAGAKSRASDAVDPRPCSYQWQSSVHHCDINGISHLTTKCPVHQYARLVSGKIKVAKYQQSCTPTVWIFQTRFSTAPELADKTQLCEAAPYLPKCLFLQLNR